MGQQGVVAKNGQDDRTGRHYDVRPPAAPWLTNEERCVLHLARRDPAGSLRTPGLFSRAVHWLFGIRPVPPLANHELERLRRLIVALRIRRELSDEDIGRLCSGAEID